MQQTISWAFDDTHLMLVCATRPESDNDSLNKVSFDEVNMPLEQLYEPVFHILRRHQRQFVLSHSQVYLLLYYKDLLITFLYNLHMLNRMRYVYEILSVWSPSIYLELI